METVPGARSQVVLIMWSYVYAVLWALGSALRSALGLGYFLAARLGLVSGAGSTSTALKPRSVNYHFTRKCNYSCGFCFHTATTSFYLPLEDAKRALGMLKDKGELRGQRESGFNPRVRQSRCL